MINLQFVYLFGCIFPALSLISVMALCAYPLIINAKEDIVWKFITLKN